MYCLSPAHGPTVVSPSGYCRLGNSIPARGWVDSQKWQWRAFHVCVVVLDGLAWSCLTDPRLCQILRKACGAFRRFHNRRGITHTDRCICRGSCLSLGAMPSLSHCVRSPFPCYYTSQRRACIIGCAKIDVLDILCVFLINFNTIFPPSVCGRNRCEQKRKTLLFSELHRWLVFY